MADLGVPAVAKSEFSSQIIKFIPKSLPGSGGFLGKLFKI